jgi:hypothetical protein
MAHDADQNSPRVLVPIEEEVEEWPMMRNM